jgi:phage FluMu gp28-like protein
MMAVAEKLQAGPAPAFEIGPMIRFDPSQERMFRDESRVIVVIWHRQKGKDFTAAAKAVNSAMETGQNWYIVSLTQRQADATFEKCVKVFEAFKAMLKLQWQATLESYEYEEMDDTINHLFVRKARELILPNGARVVSLPGKNPDTLAGLTGNIIFTEFGLFPGGGYEHWRVVFPLATRGYQVIIITTPRGKKSKAFELFSDPETYSLHFCDLAKSVAEDGFVLKDNKDRPTTMEQFKKLYGDDAGFDREFMCKFTGDLDALVSWAQLLSAQDPDLAVRILQMENGNGWSDDFFNASDLPVGRIEFGWDVARHRDLSSLWGNVARRDGKKQLAFLVLMQKTQFAMQRHIVMKGMDCRGGNVGCGDATGLGMDSNETLTTKYRDRWEAVMFSGKTKSELGSVGRTAYADGTQVLPAFAQDIKTKFIATDIYSIQCQHTENAADKRLQLSETENELFQESHCDIAYSNLLSLRAGSLMGGKSGPRHAPLDEMPVGF